MSQFGKWFILSVWSLASPNWSPLPALLHNYLSEQSSPRFSPNWPGTQRCRQLGGAIHVICINMRCFSNLPPFQCYLCFLCSIIETPTKIDYQLSTCAGKARSLMALWRLSHAGAYRFAWEDTIANRCVPWSNGWFAWNLFDFNSVSIVTDLCESFTWGKMGRKTFGILVAIVQWFALLESCFDHSFCWLQHFPKRTPPRFSTCRM